MNHRTFASFLLLASSLCAVAAEEPVPAQFKPLAPLLGRSVGRVEMKIAHHGDERTVAYKKTTTCRIGDDAKSIIMEDTEVNPWTGAESVTSSVIRYDKETRSFKAMVWDTEGAVRLFVVDAAGRSIVFKQVDCPDGSTLSSKVTVNQDGTLDEVGTKAGGDTNPYSVEWKIRYTKTEMD